MAIPPSDFRHGEPRPGALGVARLPGLHLCFCLLLEVSSRSFHDKSISKHTMKYQCYVITNIIHEIFIIPLNDSYFHLGYCHPEIVIVAVVCFSAEMQAKQTIP